MPETLSDEARELLRHFDMLPPEEQARILALVRGLSQLVYFSRVTQGAAPSSGCTHRSPV
jgi:hypothetical protein